jgi:hypothetical protein
MVVSHTKGVSVKHRAHPTTTIETRIDISDIVGHSQRPEKVRWTRFVSRVDGLPVATDAFYTCNHRGRDLKKQGTRSMQHHKALIWVQNQLRWKYRYSVPIL